MLPGCAYRSGPSKCYHIHQFVSRSIPAFSTLLCLKGNCISLLLCFLTSWYVWPTGDTDGSPRAGRGKTPGYFSPHPCSSWVSATASVSFIDCGCNFCQAAPASKAVFLPPSPFDFLAGNVVAWLGLPFCTSVIAMRKHFPL